MFFQIDFEAIMLWQFLISGGISFQCLDPVNKIDRRQIDFFTKGGRMSLDRLMNLQCTEEFNQKEPSKQFVMKKFINKATHFSLKTYLEFSKFDAFCKYHHNYRRFIVSKINSP